MNTLRKCHYIILPKIIRIFFFHYVLLNELIINNILITILHTCESVTHRTRGYG